MHGLGRTPERSTMYYYDDFGKAFKTELDFHEYLDEIDGRAQWLRIPANK